MKRLLIAIVALLALGLAVSQANAMPVPISSYNVDNTHLSGFGVWFHSYDGTMTLDGATYDYTGGSGTMNDGAIGTGPGSTHLFYHPDAPSVTVFFPGLYSIDQIELYSHVTASNWIPGNMVGLDITIGALTDSFSTTGFGAANPQTGHPVHERIDLTASALSGIFTDQVILSNFSSSAADWQDYFCISEITAVGTVIPEPGTLALMGSGLVGLLAVRRRRKGR